MFGANLVIPAQIGDELSCGQGKVYGRTDRDRLTDGRTQATTIPHRPERSMGKNTKYCNLSKTNQTLVKPLLIAHTILNNKKYAVD